MKPAPTGGWSPPQNLPPPLLVLPPPSFCPSPALCATIRYLPGAKNNDGKDPKDTSWRHSYKSCPALGPQGCHTPQRGMQGSGRPDIWARGMEGEPTVFISLRHLSNLNPNQNTLWVQKSSLWASVMQDKHHSSLEAAPWGSSTDKHWVPRASLVPPQLPWWVQMG